MQTSVRNRNDMNMEDSKRYMREFRDLKGKERNRPMISIRMGARLNFQVALIGRCFRGSSTGIETGNTGLVL